MKIIFHRTFEKKFIRSPKKLKTKIKERIVLFGNDPYNTLLNNHALQGKYSSYRSINVTGDIRIIYKLLDDNKVLMSDIGSHSELYF